MSDQPWKVDFVQTTCYWTFFYFSVIFPLSKLQDCRSVYKITNSSTRSQILYKIANSFVRLQIYKQDFNALERSQLHLKDCKCFWWIPYSGWHFCVTAIEKLIWASNHNSKYFLLIFMLIIFDIYPIKLYLLDSLTFIKDFFTPWHYKQGGKWLKSKTINLWFQPFSTLFIIL